MPILCCLDYCKLIISHESDILSLPNFFFKVVLDILCSLYFHMNAKISLLISKKTPQQQKHPAGILIRIALNLWIIMDRTDICMTLTIQIYEYGIYVNLFSNL